jgi:hypothetical protein
MSSVANNDLVPVARFPSPTFWEFMEPHPARLGWHEEEGGYALVYADLVYKEVVGCTISRDGKRCERYSCRGLGTDKIPEILTGLADRITHQVGHPGALVFHFADVVSMKIGKNKTVFNFDSLQIFYEGYSEVLSNSEALYRKDVGAVSRGA